MSGQFYQSATALINPEEILDFHGPSASTAATLNFNSFLNPKYTSLQSKMITEKEIN